MQDWAFRLGLQLQFHKNFGPICDAESSQYTAMGVIEVSQQRERVQSTLKVGAKHSLHNTHNQKQCQNLI